MNWPVKSSRRGRTWWSAVMRFNSTSLPRDNEYRLRFAAVAGLSLLLARL